MATFHTVEQGEHLAAIAHKYGFTDYSIIYNHPKNASLKRKRSNPNILYPGDVLFIPDKQQKNENRSTSQVHRFQLTSEKMMLRLALKDHEGKPLANTRCTLKIQGKCLPLATTAQGFLEAQIPCHVEEVELRVDAFRISRTLKVGHLDPVEDADQNKVVLSGIQARLNNLGYHCGRVDGLLGPQTRAALQRFQKAVMGRENAEGEPDQETRGRLLAMHGC